MAAVTDTSSNLSGQPAGQAGEPTMRDPRRTRNIRLGLFMGAIALFFYLFIMFKYKVLMA
ncbi:hypothetical protein [Azoarcus taiwanensis]|uniref:Uncharacterized protein n=1 Tax=Azoarcus taiwanensis TaxID=666964 RepID=A0A972FEY7_9RHOO|nr:hypothetical protein [Azoarcus taiwanensis]NMG04323.1 hypothetical protein [Azoarcus taiwanensis]